MNEREQGTQQPREQHQDQQAKGGKPTFWQIVISTLGAAYGVQSSKTYERDSEQRSIAPYLVAGLIFTTLFVVTLVVLVKFILKAAGA